MAKAKSPNDDATQTLSNNRIKSHNCTALVTSYCIIIIALKQLATNLVFENFVTAAADYNTVYDMFTAKKDPGE
jgi:hypothetical protein